MMNLQNRRKILGTAYEAVPFLLDKIGILLKRFVNEVKGFKEKNQVTKEQRIRSKIVPKILLILFNSFVHCSR